MVGHGTLVKGLAQSPLRGPKRKWKSGTDFARETDAQGGGARAKSFLQQGNEANEE
jgi:hypothetical protein